MEKYEKTIHDENENIFETINKIDFKTIENLISSIEDALKITSLLGLIKTQSWNFLFIKGGHRNFEIINDFHFVYCLEIFWKDTITKLFKDLDLKYMIVFFEDSIFMVVKKHWEYKVVSYTEKDVEDLIKYFINLNK